MSDEIAELKTKALYKTQQATRDVLAFIEQRPPLISNDGQAATRLYELCLAAGVYTESIIGFRWVLKTLTDRGLITREIKGKRTLRIAAVYPALDEPPPLVVADEPLEPSASDTAEPPEPVASEPLATTAEQPSTEQLEVARERSPLTATVRLQLDLDPATARLVLDLVDGSDGVVPVTRADVASMLSRMLTKLEDGTSSRLERLCARVEQLEVDRDGMSVALRAVDASATNGKIDRSKIERPNFRALGVKDSAQRKLLTDLAIDGWTFEKASNGHVTAMKTGYESLQLSATPSDHRTPLNERSRARRHGAAV